MEWEKLNIKIKDVIYLFSFVVTMVVSIHSLSNKLDNAVEKMNEKSTKDNKINETNDIWRKSIENSVSSNYLQIQLMKQEIENIKMSRL